MSAKDLMVRPVSRQVARDYVLKHHYSGKSMSAPSVNLGVYLGASLEGAMILGTPLDKRNTLHLVRDAPWNSVIELNRMVFSDRLPRNSESRALAVTFRLLRKHTPDLKWVVSYADGTQCGDGTIYRAAGFTLTGIIKNLNLARLPSGEVIHKLTLTTDPTSRRRELGGRSFFEVTKGSYSFTAYCKAANAAPLVGYQLRYIKFLDPSWAERLVPPVIPYSEIEARGASMYLGEPGRRSKDSVAPSSQKDRAVQVRPDGSTEIEARPRLEEAC